MKSYKCTKILHVIFTVEYQRVWIAIFQSNCYLSCNLYRFSSYASCKIISSSSQCNSSSTREMVSFIGNNPKYSITQYVILKLHITFSMYNIKRSRIKWFNLLFLYLKYFYKLYSPIDNLTYNFVYKSGQYHSNYHN